MLQVIDVRKKYITGDFEQIALDGVSLNLRDNEFVAILGPSGSGKTTLLNIIGGLDRYDSGDLVIDGVSTRQYKDKDWDSYRNHSVGFVFQSYNLIPHQTILSNVELALTIGGISAAERKSRALDALEEVGLREQAHKKPNQMSGGQMQRVAIARALVNNPKILLADEPTGALDTKTSVQVMDLLREVAKDRLVVMVTHNPELAEEYANRIVRVKDGSIVDDTNPLEVEASEAVHKNLGKASMSLITSFGLSLNNLMTKKGRTFLTAFAGSIGIIGIALILGLSTGFQNYINKIQEDTMTSYPLTIYEETTDVLSAILGMHTQGDDLKVENPDDLVEQQYIATMMDSIAKNDMGYFKEYLDEHEKEYKDDVTLVKYSYSVSPLIYTVDSTDRIAKVNPSDIFSAYMSGGTSNMYASYSSMGNSFTEITDLEQMKADYELLEGKWPSEYNEMILVTSDPNQISDLMLYSLGFRDNKELKSLVQSVMSGEEAEDINEPMTIKYQDVMDKELKLIDPTSLYKYNSEYDIYEDMSGDEDYLKKAYDDAETLKIVGICYSDDEAASTNVGVKYLPELTYHVIDKASESAIVKKQLENKDIDVFSGNAFDDEDSQSGLDFQDMIAIDESKLADAFQVNIDTSSLSNLGGSGISEEESTAIVMGAASAVANNLESVTQGMVSAITTVDEQVATQMIEGYKTAFTVSVPQEDGSTVDYLAISQMGMYLPEAYKGQAMNDAVFEQIASQMSASMGEGMSVSASTMKAIAVEAFDSYFAGLTPDENGLVPVEALPSASGAASQAVSNHSSEIFEEGYNLAKNYTTGLVAQGVGQAVGEIMVPVQESLSGLSNLSSMFSGDIMTVDQSKFAEAFNFDMDEDELTRLMTGMLTGENASYSGNLLNLGYQDLEKPTSVSFYFKDFDSKGRFSEWLEAYNDSQEEDKQLTYSDVTGILMGSVETIINSVTYVLIAFVSISLIVSSIMIGIITYISVLERTKEIGILRAIGASKRNISSIFNAETFIIGFLSGIIGVGVSWLLLIPINMVIHNVTNNPDITAVLNPLAALILVIIATVLTMIGGIIPSRSASRKDPVIALRTE